jgi:hypothetical protein
MARSRRTRPVAALATVAALAAAACLPSAQHFHALASDWMAEIDDQTGSIVAVHAGPAPSLPDLPIAVDSIEVRNLSPDTIEIGWRGQPATETPGWFRFSATSTGMLVSYEVIAPADVATCATYAFDVRFDRPVAAGSITARPADWP